LSRSQIETAFRGLFAIANLQRVEYHKCQSQ
jgi:hypothetical protein